jgi:hypothetical protein
MSSPRTALPFLGLSLLGTTPAHLAGQSTDSSAIALQALVAALPPSAHVRLASGGERWSGRLAARAPDSLALGDETRPRAVRLTAIDTLWVRGLRRHHGLLAGTGFGALMLGVLQLSGDTGEDPGLNTKLGLILLAGGATAGLLVDAVSDSWVQRYPAPRPR